MRKGAWIFTNLLTVAVMVAVGYLVVAHRQDIQDWWVLRSYSPPANIAQLADQTSMINFGRNTFYASQPQVEDGDAFNMHCSNLGEKSVVLGCYSGQKIYLYNVTDPRLSGVVQVTAAHEMLHAVYERYDASEKSRVDAMIEAELPKVTDARLQELIAVYAQSEPGQKLNEMHSILGTEYANLSPELQTYYQQFFGDRTKVVALANAYQSAFTQSQARIAALAAQLEALKNQINANSATLDAQEANIQAENQRLNTLRDSNPSAYNAAVPGYNQQVSAYNGLVVQTRAMIDQYNQLVVEHNNEATAQNSLYGSLNSHYQNLNPETH